METKPRKVMFAAGRIPPRSYPGNIRVEWFDGLRWRLFAEVDGLTPLGGVWEGR